jgi:hypothetical protein
VSRLRAESTEIGRSCALEVEETADDDLEGVAFEVRGEAGAQIGRLLDGKEDGDDVSLGSSLVTPWGKFSRPCPRWPTEGLLFRHDLSGRRGPFGRSVFASLAALG